MGKGALDGERLFSENIPSTIGAYITPTRTWTNLQNGWLPIQDTGLYGIFYETYWDTSAYELDDLTLFPVGINLQDGMPYTIDDYTDVDFPFQLQVVDIVSQERLDPLAVYGGLFGAGDLPGTPEDQTDSDWKQVLYCNYRLMMKVTNTADIPSLVTPVTQGQFGSLSPTTAGKLWIYRILTFVGANPEEGFSFNIPATRFVMSANIAKESDLSFLMRQKRSYELSTHGDS